MRDGRPRLHAWLMACVIGGMMSVLGPQPAVAQQPATVTVDAATAHGALNNPALYQNQSGPNSRLGVVDVERVQDIGARVVRIWAKPDAYYDENTGTFNFDYPTSGGNSVYGYLDQASGNADRMLANFDQCDQSLMDLNAPETCRAVLKAGITAYKQRHPELEYIEVFNEPDKSWTPGPGEMPPISVEDYYRWYKIAYSVVNEVNAELAPEVPLKVGGPVTYHFNGGYLRSFLNLYRDDTDPTKRLDFISYHEYGRRSNPSDVRTAKSTIRSWLVNRGLDSDTPIFVTEYGVFPGANSGTTFEEDLLTQTAAIATLGMYYVEGGMDMPMHWVFNHSSNERKSMFVDGHDGDVYPYYNLVKMQRMLKSTRIAASSSHLSPEGLGINALATKDQTGIAVLATNYQWTTGTASHDVTIRINNLPSEFDGKRIRVEQYLVDATHSNHAHDPALDELEKVADDTLDAGSTVAPAISLDVNATALVVVTPVGNPAATHRFEPEQVVPRSTSGDRFFYVADSAASGGSMVKLGANGIGDQVQFKMYVPEAGRYRLSTRVKKYRTRGICQPSVNGVAVGGPQDQYAATAQYAMVDVGEVEIPRPTTMVVACEVTGANPASSGHELSFDRLELTPI